MYQEESVKESILKALREENKMLSQQLGDVQSHDTKLANEVYKYIFLRFTIPD